MVLLGSGITLSPSATTLVRSQFIAKDFETYVSELQAFILARFGQTLYNNFVESDTGQMMLEAVSYALSALSWFVDRQAGETYIETAIIPSNLARLTRLIGYRPSGAVPAAGNVQATITAAQPFPVTINAGTQLLGPGGNIYETSQQVVLPALSTATTSIGVVEGQTIQELFTSDGTATQIFQLRRVPTNYFIAQGSAIITVGSVPWTVVNFIDFFQTNQVEVGYAENPPSVRFGDGIAGNIPPNGAQISVTYRATLGSPGAASAGTINAFLRPVIANFTVIPIVVTNTSATGPGSDVESPSKTRALAPNVFSTANRAVTETDYTTLVQAFSDPNFGSVAVGRAVISRSLDEDAETKTILALIQAQTGVFAIDLQTRLLAHWNEVLSSSCEANLISVQILQRDASGELIAPNVGLAQALKTYLNGLKEATATVSVTDGSINLFHVDTVVQVQVATGFNQATVVNAVQVAIVAFLNGKGFGDAVRLADAYVIVEAITGVVYSNIKFTQPVAKLDSFGNVVVQNFEVVTAGTTTVTPIV